MEFWVICLSFHSVTCGAKISIRGRGYNSDLTPSLYVLSLSVLHHSVSPREPHYVRGLEGRVVQPRVVIRGMEGAARGAAHVVIICY